MADGSSDDPISGLARLAIAATIIAVLVALRAARRRLPIIGR
jgi:hypothetical protein